MSVQLFLVIYSRKEVIWTQTSIIFEFPTYTGQNIQFETIIFEGWQVTLNHLRVILLRIYKSSISVVYHSKYNYIKQRMRDKT